MFSPAEKIKESTKKTFTKTSCIMKRNPILASGFFIIGLLATAMVTLSLLMSLISKPEPLNIDLIAGAVGKSLIALEKNTGLGADYPAMEIQDQLGAGITETLMKKAKQKGMKIRTMAAVAGGSQEYKPLISQHTIKTENAGPWHKIRQQRGFRQPTKFEELIQSLLSLQWNHSTDKPKREAAVKILELQHPDGGWSLKPDASSDACATGQALYALQESGMLHPESFDSQKAFAFLLKSQNEDGSWCFPAKPRALESTTFSSESDSNATEATHWASLALLEALPDKR